VRDHDLEAHEGVDPSLVPGAVPREGRPAEGAAVDFVVATDHALDLHGKFSFNLFLLYPFTWLWVSVLAWHLSPKPYMFDI